MSEIREVKLACNVDACGMYFTPRSGKKFFFLAVTEEAVADRTGKGKIFYKPAVLGNAVVRRWGFVKDLDDGRLSAPPPAASTGPKRQKPEVPAVRVPGPVSKSTPY